MKKLIEFFKWDFEGEYQQYFYVVENEESFIKETLNYLNTITINTEFPWADCLTGYMNKHKIDPSFLNSDHNKEVYFIDYNNTHFSLTKRTHTYKREDIQWEEH